MMLAIITLISNPVLRLFSTLLLLATTTAPDMELQLLPSSSSPVCTSPRLDYPPDSFFEAVVQAGDVVGDGYILQEFMHVTGRSCTYMGGGLSLAPLMPSIHHHAHRSDGLRGVVI